MGARNYTLNAITAIKKTSSLLRDLPLVGFTHDITNPSMRHGMLTTSNAVSVLYQTKARDMNYMDASGRRLMSEGFHSTAMLHEQHKNKHPSEYEFSKILNANHHIHYLKRHNDVDHLLTWSFQCSDAALHRIMLHEPDNLMHFINVHFECNNGLIDAAQQVRNTNPFNPNLVSKITMREQLYIDNRNKQLLKLTPKQQECIKWVLQGHSAKMIAGHLGISYRTVQHHLDSIRYNNGFRSLKELACNVIQQG